MRKSKKEILDVFFNEIDVNWNTNLPELITVFEEVRFIKGELLPNNWGELYLILDGIFGKYDKTCPVRYVTAGEPLMIPNQKHGYHFLALSDSRTLMTTQNQLYDINEMNPKFFPIYAKLMDRLQQHLNFREKLLSLPNPDKCDFVFNKYPDIRSCIKHRELAPFMGISEELLRRFLRERE